MTYKNKPIFLLVAIVLTFIIYYPALKAGFWLDDFSTIVHNHHLIFSNFSWDNLRTATLSFPVGNSRPISMLSFALNSYLFGLSPFAIKSINLFIHTLCSIGIYILSSNLINIRSKKGLLASKYTAQLVTSLWLLSPINLTSVLYSVQRMTSLAALFTIWGCVVYTIGRNAKKTSTSIACIIVAFLIFLPLAYYSKENGILLIPLLFLIEYFFFNFKNKNNNYNYSKTIITWYTLCLGIPLLIVLALLVFDPIQITGSYASREYNVIERLLTQFRVLWFYIGMTILPINKMLSLWHDDIVISTSLLRPMSTLWSILGIAGLLGLAIGCLRKRPLISFCIVWFFVCQSLESSIINLELVYEHRNYLASFSILFALVVVLYQVLDRYGLKKLFAPLYSFIFLYFLFVLTLRCQLWSTPLQQAIFEAQNHPKSPRALFTASTKIYNYRNSFNDPQEAINQSFKYLEQASRVDKESILPEILLISLSDELSRPRSDSWKKRALQKLETNTLIGSSKEGLEFLRKCYTEKKCTNDPRYIWPIYEAAAKLSGANGSTEAAQFSLLVLKNGSVAIDYMIDAINKSPYDAGSYTLLGSYLYQAGLFSGAKEALDKAEEFDTRGFYREAIDFYQEKIKQIEQETMQTIPSKNSPYITNIL